MSDSSVLEGLKALVDFFVPPANSVELRMHFPPYSLVWSFSPTPTMPAFLSVPQDPHVHFSKITQNKGYFAV